MSSARDPGRRLRSAAAVAGLFFALAVAGAAAKDGPAGADSAAAGDRPIVAVVPIHGSVSGFMARSFARRIEQALALDPRFIVVDIDTWGGELEPAYEIAGTIERLPVEAVALVSNRAISAGALIAFSTRAIYMLPDTHLGDCEPITTAGGRLETAPEKIVTMLRSTFENYARKNAYPVAPAIAMVDKDYDEVLRVTWEDVRGRQHIDHLGGRALEEWSRDESRRVISTEVVVPRGKLLTVSARAAAEMGLAKAVSTREEVLRALEKKAGTRLAVRELAGPRWESWGAVLTSPVIHAALLFIGILGVLIEITHPGLLFPGIAGIAGLALAFGGGWLGGQTSALDMALVAIGLVLLGIELFVLPGFGVVGFTGIGLIVVGGFLSLQTFGLPSNPWESIEFEKNLVRFGIGSLATVAAFAAALRVLPKSPVLKNVILASEQLPEDGYTVASPACVALLGRRGVALTPLRPAGKVRVGDEQLDVVTDGAWIERGEAVEVIETSENRIVVRSVSGGGA